MSKKKRRRNRQKAQPTGRNRHHLLFQGRHWNAGMAKELRAYFVYYIPISIHNELHNHLLHDVPKPPPDALKPLYLAWEEQKAEIDRLDAQNAAKWLETACDYEPFRIAMHKQAVFLEQRLGHN